MQESNNQIFGLTFKPFLDNIDNSESSVVQELGFFIMTRVVRDIFRYENEKLKEKTKKIEKELVISNEDQQIIHYVAGYIKFSITKKYKRLCEKTTNNIAKDILMFLGNFKLKSSEIFSGENFIKFVDRWTNLVNRGGLVRVNEDFYIFIRRVETIVQKILTIDLLKAYHGEDLRYVLLDEITNNNFVILGWQTLTRNLPNETIGNILFKQIIEKWVDIRGNSFVKTFMLILKRKLNKVGKSKGEQAFPSTAPAMRKTLHYKKKVVKK